MTKKRWQNRRIGHPQAARTWPPLEGAARRQAIRELAAIIRLEGRPSPSAVAHRFVVGHDDAERLLAEAASADRGHRVSGK